VGCMAGNSGLLQGGGDKPNLDIAGGVVFWVCWCIGGCSVLIRSCIVLRLDGKG